MPTVSILGGPMPAGPVPIPKSKGCSQGNPEVVEEVIATPKEAAVEYTPPKRTTPPSLADILDQYPIIELIACRLTTDDLLSLSLVSKDTHQALGQSATKDYWKHIKGKCRPLVCHERSQRSCAEARRCLRCERGVCPITNNSLAIIVDSAEKRMRYVCKSCILNGRNAALSRSPTLFRPHTINQLTAGRKWVREWMRDTENPFLIEAFEELKSSQETDVTFCPNRVDLFGMQRLNSTSSVNGPQTPAHGQNQEQNPPGDRKVVAWQNILRPKTYDPKLDRIREFETSRCMCLQAGLTLPLCFMCSMIGVHSDCKYTSFARYNTGSCECGTMVFDFPGEKEGEIIPGDIWNPNLDTLAGARGETSAAPMEETIQGLCGWCGFRVYKQKEEGLHLPATESEWLAQEQKQDQVAP